MINIHVNTPERYIDVEYDSCDVSIQISDYCVDEDAVCIDIDADDLVGQLSDGEKEELRVALEWNQTFEQSVEQITSKYSDKQIAIAARVLIECLEERV